MIKKGPPIEFNLDYIDFLNIKVNLSQRVFIPRQETEYWVKKAINQIKKDTIKKLDKKIEILDIFCGSGCIGISLLKNIKNCRVDFVDIDKKAIKQTEINLKLNNISPKRFSIIKSNMFKNINGKYDYIFANPPYVDPHRVHEVDKKVLKYEPHPALWGGKDGLFYINKFLKEVKNFIKPKGRVYFEFDSEQKNKIELILKKYQCCTLQYNFYKDQFGKYRFAILSNL